MDYISPERSLDGTCGDPGPLFGDQDGILLEHMDYGEGVAQHESPPLNDGLLVDPADQIPYLAADSLPFMNDQIPCNTMKSASTSPASPSKQAQQHHVRIESDMQNDAAEQNFHHNDSETQTTSVAYAVHQKTEVVDAVLPPELHESSGNDTSNFQQETTHSDAYLGDSMLTENSSRDYQLNNSGDDDDKIRNSSALQMENEDIRKLHETFHNEVNGTEDDQMNGMNSSPHDEQDNENFNSAIAPSDLDGMEQDDPGTRNGISTPGNQWDSPPERSAGLEKGTPSLDRRVSLSVERSPHAHSFEKLESQCHGKEDGAPSPTALSSAGDFHKLTRSRSPPARRRSQSPEKHDTNRRRASSRELSPHARENSPPERKARRESRRGDGSPRRRSASPRRRDGSPPRRSATPRRRDGSPRRSASPKRKASPKRRASPRRRDSPPRRRDSSPRRRDSSPRRRDSPTRKRDRSKSRSPSRKTDTSRHRREHGRSRSRSPHSRDHHRRSPRRRHSPRRRSPPSSHRQHSPRRPWSPPANRKTGLGKPGRNLFVAGFSYATTERDLEKKFARFGRVTSVRVVRDKRSGDSRGFGFLSLERDEDADAAIRACDETEWNGRIILVEKSKAPSW